jgi:hypothetical protein
LGKRTEQDINTSRRVVEKENKLVIFVFNHQQQTTPKFPFVLVV